MTNDPLHRSFPDAGDGRPMPTMGDELMTAGLSAEDARFVAVQLAKNGLMLIQSAPAPVVPAEELEALIAEIEFETVNGGIDRALAGRILAALRSAPPVGARVTVKPGEIERAVWSAMIWAASNNAGFNGVPEYTDRGNSFAEDEARRAAARILAALLPAGEGE